MHNPAYEQIQARKVMARLRMLQHAERVSGNVSYRVLRNVLDDVSTAGSNNIRELTSSV